MFWFDLHFGGPIYLKNFCKKDLFSKLWISTDIPETIWTPFLRKANSCKDKPPLREGRIRQKLYALAGHTFVSLWTDPAFWNKPASVEKEASDLSLWPSTALTPQGTEQSHQFLSPKVRCAWDEGSFSPFLMLQISIYLFHHISELFLGRSRPSKMSFGSPNFKHLLEWCSYNLSLKPSKPPAVPSPLHCAYPICSPVTASHIP